MADSIAHEDSKKVMDAIDEDPAASVGVLKELWEKHPDIVKPVLKKNRSFKDVFESGKKTNRVMGLISRFNRPAPATSSSSKLTPEKSPRKFAPINRGTGTLGSQYSRQKFDFEVPSSNPSSSHVDNAPSKTPSKLISTSTLPCQESVVVSTFSQEEQNPDPKELDQHIARAGTDCFEAPVPNEPDSPANSVPVIIADNNVQENDNKAEEIKQPEVVQVEKEIVQQEETPAAEVPKPAAVAVVETQVEEPVIDNAIIEKQQEEEVVQEQEKEEAVPPAPVPVPVVAASTSEKDADQKQEDKEQDNKIVPTPILAPVRDNSAKSSEKVDDDKGCETASTKTPQESIAETVASSIASSPKKTRSDRGERRQNLKNKWAVKKQTLPDLTETKVVAEVSEAMKQPEPERSAESASTSNNVDNEISVVKKQERSQTKIRNILEDPTPKNEPTPIKEEKVVDKKPAFPPVDPEIQNAAFKAMARGDEAALVAALDGIDNADWSEWKNRGGFTLLELGESRSRAYCVHKLKVKLGLEDEAKDVVYDPLRVGHAVWYAKPGDILPEQGTVKAIDGDRYLVEFWNNSMDDMWISRARLSLQGRQAGVV